VALLDPPYPPGLAANFCAAEGRGRDGWNGLVPAERERAASFLEISRLVRLYN
jgi:hypothetical protein